MSLSQCTGCQRGLPISELGMHHTETELFICTQARYRLELEPKERETFRVKRERDVPFVCGGQS
jgi:hypothetical protein